MAFKTKSSLAQKKLVRKQMLYDMPSYPEDLTDEQRREALVAFKKYLSEEILKLHPKSIERKMIGGQIADVNMQISAIRKKFRGNGDIASRFIDVARKMMTKRDFDLCMREAIRLTGLVPPHDLINRTVIK